MQKNKIKIVAKALIKNLALIRESENKKHEENLNVFLAKLDALKNEGGF